jgi:uncharacterized coiled-coil protein SlyX
VITSLELKVANLEEQLEAESRERLAQQKASRKLDKKMKELALQLDEERRHADQYKEQIEKVPPPRYPSSPICSAAKLINKTRLFYSMFKHRKYFL